MISRQQEGETGQTTGSGVAEVLEQKQYDGKTVARSGAKRSADLREFPRTACGGDRDWSKDFKCDMQGRECG